MKNTLRIILTCLTAFVLTLAVLWTALALSAAIPNSVLKENFLKSSLLYSNREAYDTSGGHLNTVADNYADVILLGVSWNMGRSDPLTGSLVTAYNDGEDYGENYGLYLTVSEDALPNTDYTRYWHGTAMFVRLFSLFTDADGIKTIGFCALLLLIVCTIVLLIRRKHADLAVMLLLSLAAVQFWNIRLSMEYQPSFILAFILLPLYLIFERRGNTPLFILSAVGGTAVAFFDFLTTETVTILLPLALVTAVRAKENRLGSFGENLPFLLISGASWLSSYALTFVVKWTAAAIVSGENTFRQAFSSVGERLGGNIADFAEPPDNIFSAPLANCSTIFGAQARLDYTRIGLGVFLICLVLASIWYLFRSKDSQPHSACILLLLGALVLLRFFVLNNHSYLHCSFTYRALITTVFSILAALWLNISLPSKKQAGTKKKGSKK